MFKSLINLYLRKKDLQAFAVSRGVKFGEGCKVISSLATSFGTEPYLIAIGDHVEISANVTFITHDGALWVLREDNPRADVFGRIVVGNNVFIGRGATLLPGTTIGDNSVVGAGAVVKGKLEANGVYAGVPARRISSFEEYGERTLTGALPTKHMSPDEKRRFLTNHFNLD